MVCDGSPCHSPQTARPDHSAIVLIFPRSKRSRNATSTILRIWLCVRTDCVSLGMGSQIDWMFLEGTSPEGSLCRSRVASSCPADSPKGKYERLKPQYAGSSGKITQACSPRSLLRRLPDFQARSRLRCEACPSKYLWTV
jgi:hypothetical protein